MGGYIIKDCPDNPATCEVTYMSQSDLKGNDIILSVICFNVAICFLHIGNIPTMVVNRAMTSQPMCVSRLRNMVEPLYINPQKDPLTVEALNNTQIPPPFEVSEGANEESPPTVTVISTAATSKISDKSVKNTSMVESGGCELVHEEPPVDTFMNAEQTVQPCDHNSLQQPDNRILQHNTTTLDANSSVTPSPHSVAVRTYTPLTNSSAEEGTASEPDSESLEESTLGQLRQEKKYSDRGDNSDVLPVSD